MKTTIIFFFLLILIFPLRGAFQSKGEVEKFVWRRVPSFSEVLGAQTIKEFVALSEDYLVSKVGFKQEIIKLRSRTLHFLGITINSDFLFSRNQNLYELNSRYFGPKELELVDLKIEKFLEYILRLKKYAEKRGSTVLIMAAPDKRLIINDVDPAILINESRLFSLERKFQDFLKANNNNIFSLSELYSKEKDVSKYFNQYDMHWNRLGAFKAVEYLIDKTGQSSLLDANDLVFDKNSGQSFSTSFFVGLHGDLLDYDYKIIKNYPGSSRFITDFSLFKVDLEQFPEQHRPIEWQNDKGQNTLLLMHDSFGSLFSEVAAFSFSKMISYNPWKKSYIRSTKNCYLSPAALESMKPDFFVVEFHLKRVLKGPLLDCDEEFKKYNID